AGIPALHDTTPANAPGPRFPTPANYRDDRGNGHNTIQRPGSPGTTAPMTIVEPILTLAKNGPAQMPIGPPGAFTLDIHNASTASAWNPTILDRLPTGATGGMCNAAPTAVTAQLFQADGTTPVSGLLAQGTDYTVAWSGAPT